MADTLVQRYVHILGVVAAYWFVSITLVFVNKALLSGSEKLEAPLFITCYQCVVTVAACYAIKWSEGKVPGVSFPDLNLDTNILKQVLPLSVIFVGMITFNNLCLLNVGVSFYYIGRSLTTVFNVLLTYFILGNKTSLAAIACCALILAGFYLGVDQEEAAGSFSLSGTVYGVLASLFVSLFSIYTKKVMPVVTSFQHIAGLNFWFLMTIGGVFGFAIGYVTGLQIKVTSPLTHNISGTAKAAAQTVLATQWFQEVKPTLWWFSNMVVLGGSLMYARVRQLEMAQQPPRADSKVDTMEKGKEAEAAEQKV